MGRVIRLNNTTEEYLIEYKNLLKKQYEIANEMRIIEMIDELNETSLINIALSNQIITLKLKEENK